MKRKKINLNSIKQLKIQEFSLRKMDKKLKNSSMRKKLYYSFILISLIGIISGLIGLIFIQKTTNDYNYALVNYGFSQGDIGKLGIEIQKSSSLIKDILFLNDSNEKKNSQKSLVSSIVNIDDLLKVISTSITTTEEKALLDKIQINLIKYKRVREIVLAKGLANSRDEGLEFLRKDGVVLIDQISSDISSLLQMKIDTCNILSAKLTMLKFVSLIIVILSIIFSLILSVFLAKHITKLISDPIDKMKIVAEEMSNGNLDVSININSNDEIGALASSFSTMVATLKNYITEISTILGSISQGNFNIHTSENYKGNFIEIKNSLDYIVNSLSKIFSQIKDATFQVNSGAGQISSTSQIISQGACEQANSIEKLSIFMEKINNQAHSTFVNADSTSLITINLVKSIENSNTQMNEMLSAMNDIENSSELIQNITKIITDISTKTNLLALNAAIEASRAGEAGNGFAVVADEVRKLSFQSADAAKQTKLLIDSSMNAVYKGRSLANNAAKTLQDLVISVNSVTDLISNITFTSKGQANSINEIHNDILRISNVVQSNSAISEECAASSEELMAQAETLNMMIDKFKLKV
jgi:Methyl-accepting chemotaxis protein